MECPITRISESPGRPPAELVAESGTREWYGNDSLWVALPRGGAEYFDDKYHMKIGWWRLVDGRLDLHAESLETRQMVTGAVHHSGYGSRGFQPSSIAFPREGCWRITGALGTAKVSFVAYVHLAPESDQTPP